MERDQSWLFKALALTAFAAACALAVRLWTGYPGTPKGENSLTVALVVVMLTALARFLIFLWRLWKSGNDRPIAAIRECAPAAMQEFLPIAIGVLVLSAFLFSLNYLKSMITAIIPFWADAPFAAMDRAMFVDPQAIAVALRPALPALGVFYGLWHIVHLGGILWVLHWRKGDKPHHIVSFMLTWSIGMAFAYLFSSAGPIFTGLYDPSVAPESVRRAADFLWANYKGESAFFGGGISAFPSMHVALAAWFALALKARGFALVGYAYLAGMFACSIILGWHYVADGVAGIAIALVADRLSRRWLARGPTRWPLLARPASVPN